MASITDGTVSGDGTSVRQVDIPADFLREVINTPNEHKGDMAYVEYCLRNNDFDERGKQNNSLYDVLKHVKLYDIVAHIYQQIETSARACFHLGMIYLYGFSGFPENIDKAIFFYERAYSLGYLDVACEIAEVFTYANKDVAKCRHWLDIHVKDIDDLTVKNVKMFKYYYVSLRFAQYLNDYIRAIECILKSICQYQYQQIYVFEFSLIELVDELNADHSISNAQKKTCLENVITILTPISPQVISAKSLTHIVAICSSL